MKKIMRWVLTATLLAWLLTASVLATEASFSFDMAVDGEQKKTVSPGDILTVTLTLQQESSDEAYEMYAMQDEICYDSEFFQLVEGSVQAKPGISTTDIALLDNYRAFYMNYLSMSSSDTWEDGTLVGSFQLKVIGAGGAARLFQQNSWVSIGNGRETAEISCQEAVVIVSETCTVQFHTKGGSFVENQAISRGGKVVIPEAPSRTGYYFGGWFKDIECTQPWEFEKDRVEVNLHLYAKWLAGPSELTFTDVKQDDWFFSDVQYVAGKGLITGVGDGRFAPDQKTSRAMIVTILWRLEGQPEAEGKLHFQDVPTGLWYAEAVGWAAEHGIVTGYSSQHFGPNDGITREQMAVILFRYASCKGHDLSGRADLYQFKDYTKISSWALDALAWANQEGLICGISGDLLAPQGQATRSQAAAILHRFCVSIQ